MATHKYDLDGDGVVTEEENVMGRLAFKMKAAKYVFDNGTPHRLLHATYIRQLSSLAGFGTCVAVSWVMLANFFAPNGNGTKSDLCSQGTTPTVVCACHTTEQLGRFVGRPE